MTENTHPAFLVGGWQLPRPPALRAGDGPEVHRFSGRDRAGEVVNEIVVHETVTRSAHDAVRVLERRGLGVHFIVDEHGAVDQHADPVSDRMAHAGRRHNGPSVGIEIVNPYYPRYLRDDLPWKRLLDAPWAHQRRYVLPTPAQAEATAQLVAWLTSGEAEGLDIPRRWVSMRGSRMEMGRVAAAARPCPGVMAHTAFGHADGPWLVLYAWLRLEAGLAPCVAFEEAARRAAGVRRVELEDLVGP